MITLNLNELKVYKGLDKKDYVTCNGAKEIANFIYNNAAGLPYHALAIKLYNSEGIVQLDEEEEKLLVTAVNLAIPAVIDAISERIKESHDSQTKDQT